MTWTLTIDDAFNRADTTPGLAETSTGAGNGWIDAQGGVAQIANNHLKITGDGTSNGLYQDLILRPTSENQQDQRLVSTFDNTNGVFSPAFAAVWHVHRYTSGPNGYFILANPANSQLQVFYVHGVGTGDQIGSTVTISPTWDASHNYTIDSSVVGINPTAIAVTIIDTTTGAVVASFLHTDIGDLAQVAGQMGYTANSSHSNANTTLIAEAKLYASSGTDFSISPSNETTNAGAATGSYTVAPNGIPPSSTTVALSDGGAGGTFTSSSLTFTTATNQSFIYTPALSASGAITLSATATGGITAGPHTTTCTISGGAAVVVPVNNPNWFFSPYNWFKNGSSEAVASAPGAYFKIGFTGTSATLGVQVSQITGSMPKVCWSIDGGVFQVAQLSEPSLALASGLASGDHTLQLYLMATQGGSGWSSLTNVLWVTGLTLDSGCTPIAPMLASKRALFDGDSITQGVSATGSLAEGIVGDDSLFAFAANLGIALGAEYGQLGYTGLGWTVASAGGDGPPAFFTPANDTDSSWNKYWAGNSRLVGGAYSPSPDYIFTVLGRNDFNQAGSAVTAAVTGWLAAVRTATPSAWVFLVVPFDGSCRSVITAGFAAYQTATPDTKAILLDLHADADFNLSLSSGGSIVPTAGSPDGTHPNYQLHAVLGAQLAHLAQAAIGNSSGTASGVGSRARVANE